MMWPLTRRVPVTQAANIDEFDRPLVTALVANAGGLSFGQEPISSRHGVGAVTRVLIGETRDRLEWLEQATITLGAEVTYMPIRPSAAAEVRAQVQKGIDDGLAGIAHAADQARAAEAIRTGTQSTGRPDIDRELRRIVDESQDLRRRTLDRDLNLARLYIGGHPIDPALPEARSVDRQRSAELRDEYVLMHGGEPKIWPF